VLALRWAQNLVDYQQHEDALELLERVWEPDSTAPAHAAVARAVPRISADRSTLEEAPKVLDPRYARFRRPDGRRRINPHSVSSDCSDRG
jgi:hypothetical protein